MTLDLLTASAAPSLPAYALRAVPMVPRSLTAPLRATAPMVRADAGDRSPMDVALVAVAAADGWAQGNGLPPPRAYLAGRLLDACKRVQRRHHALVTESYHARAGRCLDALAGAVNAAPAPVRAAVLASVLLDLLNDRPEPAFAAVSDALARVDRECPRDPAHDAERIASVIAERVREEHLAP